MKSLILQACRQAHRRSFMFQARAHFSTQAAAEEKPFDYSTMDFYQILEVSHGAADTEVRKSFLKLAKRYHPDVYKGPNKDHFKKVLEAYNTLKSPVKRSDYDKHARVKSARSSKDFQDFERRMHAEGKDASHEAYERMRAT